MRFTKDNEIYDIKLSDGDLIILTGDSRYKWKHELLPNYDKNFYRISITYRTIIN